MMEDLPLHITSKAAASQKPKPATKRGGKGRRPTAKHEDKEQILMIPLEYEAINKTTISTDLAAKQAEGKEAKSWSELVPPVMTMRLGLLFSFNLFLPSPSPLTVLRTPSLCPL